MSLAQLLAAVALVLAGSLRATDRRIERHLRGARATTPSMATDIPRRHWLSDLRVRRFLGAGAIREHQGKYYLDEQGWRRFRALRRRRALGVVAVMLGGLALAWWLGWVSF